MIKYLFAFVMLVLGAGAAHACNVPNPNLNAPPFVDGCDVPAVALNRLIAQAPPEVFTPATPQTAGRTTCGTYNVLDTSNNPLDIPSNFNCDFDGLAAVVTATAGTTLTNTNAIAGYVHNKLLSSGNTQNSVALMGNIVSEVNGAQSWGINTIMQDKAAETGVNLQNEFDLNVLSTATKAYGLVVTGASTAQGISMAAFVAAPPSLGTPGVVKYNQGSFWSEDAATNMGMQLGAQGVAGASVPSQLIQFNYYDAGSTYRGISLGATSTSSLAINSLLSGATTGVAVYNNLASATNTAATLSVNTFSAGLAITETQQSASVAGGAITETGTGGLNVTAGTGGLFFLSLASGAHTASTTCLGINTSTGAVYASTTVTTC